MIRKLPINWSIFTQEKCEKQLKLSPFVYKISREVEIVLQMHNLLKLQLFHLECLFDRSHALLIPIDNFAIRHFSHRVNHQKRTVSTPLKIFLS